MRRFLELLIRASEKAANIARIIRNDESLFQLLIEEKGEDEKNTRFVQDFKTLADVLIQECLRWEVSQEFPEMTTNIFGEESNTFTNNSGDSVTIEIQSSEEKTAALLLKILGGNDKSTQAASRLANVVHSPILNIENNYDVKVLNNVPESGVIDAYDKVGIWIDPIDATNEYVKGNEEDTKIIPVDAICQGGLRCVTVLIGAFCMETGNPIAGVINLPFYQLSDSNEISEKRWSGRVLWGISHGSTRIVSNPLPRRKNYDRLVTIISSSEDEALKSKLKEKFEIVSAPGAGYKLYTVVAGLADLYVLSKSTTHFWDTCGPHAILQALCGDVIQFRSRSIPANDISHGTSGGPLTYRVSSEAQAVHFQNLGGIVAFRHPDVMNVSRELLDIF